MVLHMLHVIALLHHYDNYRKVLFGCAQVERGGGREGGRCHRFSAFVFSTADEGIKVEDRLFRKLLTRTLQKPPFRFDIGKTSPSWNNRPLTNNPTPARRKPNSIYCMCIYTKSNPTSVAVGAEGGTGDNTEKGNECSYTVKRHHRSNRAARRGEVA